MELQTRVLTSNNGLSIDLDTPICFIGSCFSNNIGTKSVEAGFNTLINPFGTLYNPMSIAECLTRCIDNHLVDRNELFYHDGLWHSWLHHSSFSHVDQDHCTDLCNQKIAFAHDFFKQKPIIVVTFGTAYVFRHEGHIVGNCHKVAPNCFTREKCTIDDILSIWQPLVERLATNDIRILFTVSPIRHMADGAHGNQLSKSTLLMAIDGIHNSAYFPSYEIMMDELRDYRFYAEDMSHPSPLATQIIWERFQETYMSPSTRNRCNINTKQYKRTLHRQINTSLS